MVLELLFRAGQVELHPIYTLFDAIILSSASLLIAYYTFPESASVLAIALLTLGAMPLMHQLYLFEERKEVERPGPSASFIARHFALIKIFAWFFIGLIISYSTWFAFLPAQEQFVSIAGMQLSLPGRELLFKQQIDSFRQIEGLREQIKGQGLATETKTQSFCTGRDFWSVFNCIFSNNSFVLGLAVLFSFAYGAGAIFLIAWNASVIGVIVGMDMLALYSSYAGFGVIGLLFAYVHGLVNAIGFLPHGSFELTAYFIGSIAGGIISVTLTKKKYSAKEFEMIAKDTLILLFLAYFLLFLGAMIEADALTSQIIEKGLMGLFG